VTANAEGTLLASSPARGVHRSVDGGESWTLLLAQEGVYHAESRGRLLAVAGETGLQVSDDGGGQWRSVAGLAGKRLSSVAFARFNDTVTVGGWVEGLWTYDIGLDQLHTRQSGLPVVHVRETNRGTVAGSWGRGLHLYPASPETPLLITATLAGDAAVVEALLRSGAEPDVFDRVRNTPLILASRDGHLDIARLLIEHGADVNGADVNWIDGERATPLILAAHKNHPAVAKLLLEHGADPSTVDDFGETARSYAARRGTDDPILGWLR